MAQECVAGAEEQHTLQVRTAEQHFYSAETALSERFRREVQEETEVCRSAALEMIAKETQTGRSAMPEALTYEQAEFGRVVFAARAATARGVREAMSAEFTEEWNAHVSRHQLAQRSLVSEVVQARDAAQFETNAAQIAIARSKAGEQAMAQQLMQQQSAALQEMRIMESRLKKESKDVREEARAALQEASTLKGEMRTESKRREQSFEDRVKRMTVELMEARSSEESARARCLPQKTQVEQWATSFKDKFYDERKKLVEELAVARQDIDNLKYDGVHASSRVGGERAEHNPPEPESTDFSRSMEKGVDLRAGRTQSADIPPGLGRAGVGRDMVPMQAQVDSDDSSEDEHRRRRGIVKTICLAPIPTAIGFRRWHQEMFIQVCASSKRSQRRTMAWLKETETKNLEELEVPSVGIPLQREILVYQERWTRQGFSLTGRAALWHVLQRFTMERGQAIRVDMKIFSRWSTRATWMRSCKHTITHCWPWLARRILICCSRWYKINSENAWPWLRTSWHSMPRRRVRRLRPWTTCTRQPFGS